MQPRPIWGLIRATNFMTDTGVGTEIEAIPAPADGQRIVLVQTELTMDLLVTGKVELKDGAGTIIKRWSVLNPVITSDQVLFGPGQSVRIKLTTSGGAETLFYNLAYWIWDGSQQFQFGYQS